MLRPLLFAAAVACAMPAFARDAQEEPSPTAPAEDRQAVPRGNRPQGDNPATGTAVRRTPRPAAPPAQPAAPPPATTGRNDRGGRDAPVRNRAVIVNPPPVYNSYYPYYPNVYHYYPRNLYPFGYGAFGLGYFYYDPYRWYGYSPYYYDPYPRYGSSAFDIGELRLDVSPWSAQVFVDGYYAGTVDDFDGAFQAIKMQPGQYQIRMSAPGFEDLIVDVRINPGQKMRYKGELRRLP